MGELYADLGETERARASFEAFLDQFADADPDNPFVTEAEQGLAQLESRSATP